MGDEPGELAGRTAVQRDFEGVDPIGEDAGHGGDRRMDLPGAGAQREQRRERPEPSQLTGGVGARGELPAGGSIVQGYRLAPASRATAEQRDEVRDEGSDAAAEVALRRP